jgi:hypothetical protein
MLDLQVLVEPGHSLAKSLLFGELVVLVAQVGTDSEAVGDTAVQVDLPRISGLDQDLLGLMAEGGCEDVVDFFIGSTLALLSTHKADLLTSSADRQGASDGGKFLLGDERGVGGISDINLAGLQETADVLIRDSLDLEDKGLAHNPLGEKKLTLPPKQYPTAPMRLTPTSCLRYLMLASTTGSTTADWWLGSHAGRSAFPLSMSLSLIGSPWKRSGMIAKYPFSAYSSARS